MNIKLRNIPKFLWGGSLLPYYWNGLPTIFSFNNLSYYDPRNYPIEYDTSKLVNGDIFDTIIDPTEYDTSNYTSNLIYKDYTTDPLKYNGKKLDPWQSKIQGNVLGRYQPTTGYGSYGEHKNHYNYTENVEKNPYYEKFGEALVDEKTGKFTPTGEAWARAVDVLLPPGSKASFFGENNLIRDSWTVKDNDVHGRAPKTFNNLKDYVNYVRKDLILGARHNIFLSKGTRYFYTDEKGYRHWVSPEEAKKYELSSEPVEQGWEGGTYWNDYELLGLKNDSPSNTSSVKKEDGSSRVDPDHKEKYGFDWNKIQSVASKILNNPNLYAAGRLAGNLISNERVYDEYIKGIRPNLLQTYQTHRQVLGDEATKQAYYRRAAQGLTKAAQPFTSDADKQVAYMNEAKRVGDELRAQGDLADNQEIRRTSDESNQHQWANTQRATEVANTNLASLNKALADKHSILAQKHAANWSSVDNFLLGLETRNNQKIAERKALLDLVWALQAKDTLSEDPEIIAALKAITDYEKSYRKEYGKDPDFSTDTKYRDLYKDLKKVLNKVQIRLYKKRALLGNDDLLYAKDGNKITYKKKDDLLYKTAKDTVDHFREMSKLLKRKRKDKQEIVKLAPHPKGSTRRYLLGGVAPFTVYKPAPLGGETTISSQGSTSSTKADKVDPKKESLDMIKKLFESVSAHGIPIDASLIYKDMNNFLAKSRLFGDELSTDDIASMYVNMMYKVNNLKFSGEVYNKAREAAANNAALNEYAVDASGNVVVLDKESKGIKLVELSEFLENRDKYTPLTNNMLLQMRAYNPEMAFRNGDNFMNNIVANGIGITKISEYIKNLIGTLGTNEEKIEGLSKIESGKVKEGIRIIDNLINAAPDGVYKLSLLDKTQKSLVEAAFRYVMGSLPILQKAILQLHASEVGMDLKDLILNRLTSNTGYTHNIEIDPLTGKAAKDANGNSKNGDANDFSPAVAFFNGLGEKESFIIQDKTSDGLKINTISTTITSNGHNTGAITFDKLESSDFGGLLFMNQATMGDSLISSTGRNNIIIDGRIYQAELPIDEEAKRNGITKPDLKFLKNIEKADAQLKQMGIDKSDKNNIVTINKVYKDNNLPILYTMLNNKPVITSRYARFAIVNGVATEDAFGDNPEFNDAIKEIDSNKERQLFETAMLSITNNLKYKLKGGHGIGGVFSWGETKLYKGTIYIPMTNSNISALAGTGFKAKGEEYNLIEARQQEADAARIKGYVPAGNNLNNN